MLRNNPQQLSAFQALRQHSRGLWFPSGYELRQLQIRRPTLVGLALLALVLLVLSTGSHAANTIDSVVTNYKTAAEAFGNNVRSVGVKLLFQLFGIQLALHAIGWLLKGKEIGEILGAVVYSILSVSFFYALQGPLQSWLPTVIDGFTEIGRRGSGLATLTPSTIIAQASDLIGVVINQFKADGGPFAALTNFVPVLLIAFITVVIYISYCVLAAQMALAMISGYFWLAFMPVLLGFGGISFTKDIAVNALKGGIAIGMKIAVVYLVAGIARSLGPVWGEALNQLTIDNLEPIWQIGFTAMLLAYLSFQLPKLAADLMNGTASLSAGDAATNMAVAAAGVAGVGAMGAKAGAAVAGTASGGLAGAAGLAQAVGAGLNAAQDMGKSGVSALAHAGQEVAAHGLSMASAAASSAAAGASSSFGDRVAESTGGKIAQSIEAGRGGSFGAAAGGGGSQAPAPAGQGSGSASASSPAAPAPASGSAGNAAGASLSAGQPSPAAGPGFLPADAQPAGSSAGGGEGYRGPSLAEKLRSAGDHLPQDQHTVGLSANLGHGHSE